MEAEEAVMVANRSKRDSIWDVREAWTESIFVLRFWWLSVKEVWPCLRR